MTVLPKKTLVNSMAWLDLTICGEYGYFSCKNAIKIWVLATCQFWLLSWPLLKI